MPVATVTDDAEKLRLNVEDLQVVWSALQDYKGSKVIRGKALDFADALIARKSEYVAQARNRAFFC